MPYYVLDQHDRIPLARRPLRVELASAGAPGAAVLVARRGLAVDPTAMAVRPGVLILPRVQERTVIRVEPGDGFTTFPAGTVVTLRLITEEARGEEPDVITVEPLNVSGLDLRDVAEVDVDGDRLAVSALHVVPDEPLGELAAAARSATRAALGIDRVADEDARHVAVGVDLSTSMWRPVTDGSVAAAIEVLVGLSHVIGEGKRPRICLLGDHETWVRPVPVEELAEATGSAIAAAGLGCGFHAVPQWLRGAPREASVMYILTDGLPGDVDELRRANRRPGDVRHVVAIGAETTPLGGDPPATRMGLPSPGRSVAGHLLGPGPHLTRLVTGLLVGCFPDDSPLAARVLGRVAAQ